MIYFCGQVLQDTYVLGHAGAFERAGSVRTRNCAFLGEGCRKQEHVKLVIIYFSDSHHSHQRYANCRIDCNGSAMVKSDETVACDPASGDEGTELDVMLAMETFKMDADKLADMARSTFQEVQLCWE